MTDTYAMTPKQALAAIEAVGVEDPAKLVRDHAAAGLVRSYAQLQVTIGAGGTRHELRGGRVQPATWERIIAAGVESDVWSGGTARLPGSDLIGGAPAIHVTGVAFHPGDIDKLAGQQQPPVSRKPRAKPSVPASASETTEQVEVAEGSKPQKRRTGGDAIPPGAVLCTIKQAGEALGVGRTKVNDLMKAGRLERVEDVAGVRITVASVKALTGSGKGDAAVSVSERPRNGKYEMTAFPSGVLEG